MSKVDWRKEREIADKAQTAAIIERSGFVEVSQDDFYKVIGPLNVHPHASYRHHSEWRLINERGRMVGITSPGYMGYGWDYSKENGGSRYYVSREFVK